MGFRDEAAAAAKQFRYKVRVYQGLLAAALIFALIAGFYAFGDSAADPADNPYQLLDPARQYIAQEDFVVNIQPLREALNELVAAENDIAVTLYYEQLNTGGNISINPDLRLNSASLNKLPVAMVAAKKVELGQWNWQDLLVLDDADVNDGSGDLFRMPVGTKLTIGQLLEELLVRSDNTALYMLYRNITNEDANLFRNEIGLEALYDEEGRASAKEYARIFRALYTASFLNRENSEKVLRWLVESRGGEYLSRGLPEEVVFAHKYGRNETERTLADAGIVYLPNRPYILVVLMQLPDSSEQNLARGTLLMKEISQKAHEYLQ